ncbi:MAG: Mur ligase domain-containing protein, partial [Terriglobia bacterium]
MILRDLLRGAEVLDLRGSAELEIRSLAYDSRQVGPGCVFFAIRGERADGHRFLGEVLERGAAA